MRIASSGGSTHSQITVSLGSSLPASPSLDNPKAKQQCTVQAQLRRRSLAPSHLPTMLYSIPPYPTNAYSASLGALFDGGSLRSPSQVPYPITCMHTQRAIGSGFQPRPRSAAASQITNHWEHQRYIGHYSPSNYPQTQRRYICPTCNKGFSRPSGLRIHSHSHTGEKPFRCLHPGCSKAFSVRSNMERHKRSCCYSAERAVGSAAQIA